MIGTISLATSLFFSLLAVLSYGYAMKDETGARYGRICFSLSFFAAAVASLYLWVLILGNHFEIAYVSSYSSKDLPLMYKISAFWAGQQGSLLLWLLIHAAASICLCFRRRMEDAGLMVYAILESLLVILVLAKSPFVAAATAAQDGMGLNPLLQDPWMAVHPPIIFIGYALLAVPFAYCMGSLVKKPASFDWLESARRWALLAWGFLGGGVFVGGYWAYKVLGWGGYWGWDPVENSSLAARRCLRPCTARRQTPSGGALRSSSFGYFYVFARHLRHVPDAQRHPRGLFRAFVQRHEHRHDLGHRQCHRADWRPAAARHEGRQSAAGAALYEL